MLHPAFGRFMQRDPLGYVDGLNASEYVRSNPGGGADPSGYVVETIWDVGNLVYDVGRGIKNGVELAYGAGKLAYKYLNGDDEGLLDAYNGLQEDLGDLGEVAVDATTDAVASVVPGVPAGGTKIGRKLLGKVDDAADALKKAPCPSPKKITKSESPQWQQAKPYRGKTKTNGKSGKDREYYEWDNTHGDIEVYDSKGKHLGTKDPKTGNMIKPAVPGRRIDL